MKLINNLITIFKYFFYTIKNFIIFSFLTTKEIEKKTINIPVLVEEKIKKVEKYEDKYKKEWEILKSQDKSIVKINSDSFYLLENCPIGNVVLYYNKKVNSFEYYSDVSIPYRYLETIGRRYAIISQNPSIYIDMNDEINKKRLEIQNKSTMPIVEEKQNNVFVKFKSYNGKSTQKSNNTMSKGRVETNIQIPVNLKRQFKSAIREDNGGILVEVSNIYINKGKLHCFSFLKKHESKNKTLSYKDFMNQQKNKK